MKAAALLRQTARQFARAGLRFGHGTRNAREEAMRLLSFVLGSPFDFEEMIGPENERRIQALVRKRIHERIPLAYLLKEAWLGEHSFYVDQRAIVPRSFIAELLRERLRPWLAREPKRVLDLCTGSGCLAVLLALTFAKARVEAADLSVPALAVAKKNIERYMLNRRIKLVRSDLFSSLGKVRYDLVVCNPPYVRARSMRKLPKEYRHEPALAMAAGKDGLDLVRRILAGAADHLTPGGLLVCEIGGNRRALERSYPRLDIAWPETSDPGTVFILERAQLRSVARKSAAPRTPPRQGRAPR